MEFEDGPTESETQDDSYEEDDENDSDWHDEELHTESFPVHTNYVSEITSILSQNQFVNVENALELNSLMQMRLLKLRTMLEALLEKCKQKYERNTKTLQKSLKRVVPVMPSFRICGAPFFRDMDNFAAPLNEDYIYRSERNDELFPIDLKLIPQRYWTAKDKCTLVKAIKSQILDYLQPLVDADSSEIRKMLEITQKKIKLHTIPLATLLRKVGSKFEINWKLVSQDDLSGRHSDQNCYAMWHGYMKPELNRRDWTKEENLNLMAVAEKYNFQEWAKISQEVPHRSEYQCFLQFQNNVNMHLLRNKKWIQSDDRKLLAAVETNKFGGLINWNKVSSYFPNRTRKQIYTRYKYALDPDMKKGPFTREEDCILLAAVEEYGENFGCIPMTLFPNRTRIQVKSRYLNSLKHHEVHRSWTIEDDTELLQFVEEHGTSKWNEVAQILNGHTRISCRTRYTVIMKFLAKNPSATIKDIPRKNKKKNAGINLSNWVDKIYELKTQGDVYGKELEKRREKRLEKRNKPFREQLRPPSREFYELFKYSYDYSFGKDVEPTFPIKHNLKYLFDCFGFTDSLLQTLHIRRTAFTAVEYSFLKQVSPKKNSDKSSEVQRGSIVPANWSTLLGLRAVSILVNSDKFAVDDPKKSIKLREPTEAESIFKERFFKMFYQAALLSKITVKNTMQTKYVIKYLPATSTADTPKEEPIEKKNSRKRKCKSSPDDSQEKKRKENIIE